MAEHPLLAHGRDVPVIDGQRVVSRQAYLGQLRTLARALPAGDAVINLCEDRYSFLLAFGAALLRSQVTLLPPNRSPETVAMVAATHGPVEVIDDATVQALVEETSGPGDEAIPQLALEQAAATVFTSGTTGTPLPNRKDLGTLVEGARRVDERLGLSPGCGIVATVPPQHMFGLEMSVMLPLVRGKRLLPERPFFPVDIAAALGRLAGPRVLFTTPLHLRACLREEGVEWPAIERIVVSTAPLAVELAQAAEARLGCPVTEIYGSSETGALATRATATTEEWSCLSGVRIRHEGGAVKAGGGHIPEPVTLNDSVEVRSPTTFRLLGRGEDLVDRAGKRASLGGLSQTLLAIKGVEDGVFLQPASSDGGASRLIALVVAPTLNEEAIREELRRWVDPVFLPRPLYKVDRLPRNELGKLPREALQTLLQQMGEE